MDTEIIFFTASWCGPCKQMKNILSDSIKKELNIRFADIEADNEYQTYNIMAVPAFIKVKNNKEIARLEGMCSIDQLKGL